MNDSRIYNEKECSDNNILKKTNITNNYEYRQYLQKNANNIISLNQINSFSNNKFENNNYILNNNINKDSKYGYSNSNLKNIYISREFLNKQLNNERFLIK